MVDRIANIFADQLGSAILVGGREPDIVRRFVNGLRTQTFPPRVEVRTEFIHTKPYAFFVTPPQICNRRKCEVGDLAYVIKRVRGQNLIDHRVCFGQVKLFSRNVAHIQPHQLEFYTRLHDLGFRFGKSVYDLAGSQPLVFRKLTRSTWFGHYLLLGTPVAFVAKPSVIDMQYHQDCSDFSFIIPPSFPFHRAVRSLVCGCYDYETYLLNFLQLKGLGPTITGKLRDFVTIIYKRVGWELDPPEETEEYFEESESGGFGVIEIKISLPTE